MAKENQTINFHMRYTWIIVSLSLIFSNAIAQHRVVNLHLGKKEMIWNGKTSYPLAINDSIPAPTLRFTEGDHVTINVHNHLDEGTSIHWHGVLLPWYMDGVEGVTQDPILPGDTFSYQFTLKQSGTYWYHAHSGFQEQQGIYGAFIIAPKEPSTYSYNRDFVVVLSDWIQEDPMRVLSHLKADGDYYTPRFPLQPSLFKFLSNYFSSDQPHRQELIDTYLMMQNMRMSIYDLSDVGYDAYLLNGRTHDAPWTESVSVGDIVRLRFIGAGGSSIYRIKIPDHTFQIVHIQGNDVEPQNAESFTLAPGETVDILLKITEDKPYTIYAESSDMRGKVCGILRTNDKQECACYNITPFPEPLPVGHSGHQGHAGHSGHEGHMEHRDYAEHNGHEMHHHDNHVSSHMHDGSIDSPKSTGTKYGDLKSLTETNDPQKPVEAIRMELYGYMGKFMWFINGLPESETHPIIFQPGKRYRFIFTNSSMMIHPMHIHGHFFIYRNGHGSYDPLLHTIEVPPGAHVIADVDAYHVGQWFFHCHHLYHMASGMSRVIRYSNFMSDYEQNKEKVHINHSDEISSEHHSDSSSFIKNPVGHPAHIFHSFYADIGYDPFHNVQKGDFMYRGGWDRQKIQLAMEDAEIQKGTLEKADLDVFYWHLISEFWALKGGLNILFKPGHQTYCQPGIGIEGTAPFFIDTDIRLYLHQSLLKADIDLKRDTLIAHNFYLRTGVRAIIATKTKIRNQIGSGVNYLEYTILPFIAIAPGWDIYAGVDLTQYYGKTKKIRRHQRLSSHETVAKIGFAWTY